MAQAAAQMKIDDNMALDDFIAAVDEALVKQVDVVGTLSRQFDVELEAVEPQPEGGRPASLLDVINANTKALQDILAKTANEGA